MKSWMMPCVFLMACGGGGDADGSTDGSTPTDTAGSSTVPTDYAGPTFYQDVAPILDANCVSCHQDGGIAPFSLETAEMAQAWANASAAAVAGRTMPPWGAVDDGTCGGHSFRDSRWMAQEDIDTLVQWAELGTVLGPEASRQHPVAEHLEEGTDLQTPEYVAEGTVELPDDEYRCFLVDPGVAEDVFVTAYELFPGNPGIVHHAIAMPIDPNSGALDQIATVDGADGRPGWPCWSGLGDDATGDSIPYTSQSITWTPGQGVVRYPEGYGVRLPAGYRIGVQMHYNLVAVEGTAAPDSTVLRLETTDRVDRELIPALLDDFLATADDPEPMTIEPGRTDAVVSYRLPWDDEIPFGLEIVGLMPHMHGYGRKMKVHFSMEEGKYVDVGYDPATWGAYDEACGIRVDDWAYEWQMNYFFDEPIKAPKGTETTVTCVYDTTATTEPVYPGLGTQEEMCLIGMFLAIDI